MNGIPIMYDIAEDRNRPVTQADVDRLLQLAKAMGEMVRACDAAREAMRAANLNST